MRPTSSFTWPAKVSDSSRMRACTRSVTIACSIESGSIPIGKTPSAQKWPLYSMPLGVLSTSSTRLQLERKWRA